MYMYMYAAAYSLLRTFVPKLVHARPHNALHSPSQCKVKMIAAWVCRDA